MCVLLSVFSFLLSRLRFHRPCANGSHLTTQLVFIFFFVFRTALILLTQLLLLSLSLLIVSECLLCAGTALGSRDTKLLSIWWGETNTKTNGFKECNNFHIKGGKITAFLVRHYLARVDIVMRFEKE